VGGWRGFRKKAKQENKAIKINEIREGIREGRRRRKAEGRALRGRQ